MSGAGEGRGREGEWRAREGPGAGPGGVQRGRALSPLCGRSGPPTSLGCQEPAPPGHLEGFGAGLTASTRVPRRRVLVRGYDRVSGVEFDFKISL